MKFAIAAVLALTALPVCAAAQDSLATSPPATTPPAEQEQAAKPAAPELEAGVIYLVEGETS